MGEIAKLKQEIFHIMDAALKKLPRLYVDAPLTPSQTIIFEDGQAHYLRSVLRKEVGANVRLFNGRDGEWLASLTQCDKKSVVASCNEMLLAQNHAAKPLSLIFAPIKKARLDMLIEKSVELGVTDLYPIITQNTENRSLNPERTLAQIIEAAEQCERLDIPRLHPAKNFDKFLNDWDETAPIAAAIERMEEAPHISQLTKNFDAIIIGPEGGFTENERAQMLRAPFIIPVNLGPRILRAETAGLYALSLMSTS